MSHKLIRNSTAEFLIFTGQAGEQSIEARYEDETVWLSQKLMAELFAVTVPTINEHLKNIFDSGELNADSVIRKFRTTAADGKTYQTQFYNLDAMLSVGYRVKSAVATRFSARSQAPLGNAILEALLPLARTGEAELPVPDSQAEISSLYSSVRGPSFRHGCRNPVTRM